MSPDRDLGRRDDDGREIDDYADETPRSLFSALWFRALLAVLVLGILAAVAVPYVLDFATSPSLKTSAKPVPGAPPSPAPTPTRPTAAPAASAPAPAATATVPAATAAAPVAPAAGLVTAAPASPPPSAPPATAEPAKPKMAPVAVEKPAAKTTAKTTKVAEAPTPAPKAPAAKPSAAKAATVAATGGPYWVQVGAFKEPETATRVAARLRALGFHAEESTTRTVAPRSSTEPPTGGTSVSDRYDVVVSGASAADVNARLAAKGMTGESTANGIVVRPSLPLREAVALSRDLADAGLSVQVRRVGGPAPVAAPAPAPVSASGGTLHRVRVGGFPDRASAAAAAKQLEEKGFKTFIARGNE